MWVILKITHFLSLCPGSTVRCAATGKSEGSRSFKYLKQDGRNVDNEVRGLSTGLVGGFCGKPTLKN